MHKKQLRLRDFQIKKNLKWHILRLLRLNMWMQQELMDKISDMYMGYWKAKILTSKSSQSFSKVISKFFQTGEHSQASGSSICKR